MIIIGSIDQDHNMYHFGGIYIKTNGSKIPIIKFDKICFANKGEFHQIQRLL